ncbi:hypothetical protein, partial [Xanthomonas theicola]|uniref:hypothetical protein n=1 Tax=Xanthomonas theicola TaxID=56464 RepID=UPI001B80DE7C
RKCRSDMGVCSASRYDSRIDSKFITRSTAHGRLMKFYRKAGAESKRYAQNNAESFKRIYNDADVKLITLEGVDQRLYYAVEMPKIKGISLSGIRATGDVGLIVAVADEIIKKDIVG